MRSTRLTWTWAFSSLGQWRGVDRVLHHREAVPQQSLAEVGIRALGLLRIDRQVEHGDDPHTTVSADLHGEQPGLGTGG